VEPSLIGYKNLVYSDEGEETTLEVDFNGYPYPNVTWFFDGMRLEEEKSEGRELTEDGYLYIPKVQQSHAGTYDFIISNPSGSVEGCTKLIVYLKDKSLERNGPVTKISTNPVKRERFGEHVAKYHKNNDSGFSEEFEVCVMCVYLLRQLRVNTWSGGWRGGGHSNGLNCIISCVQTFISSIHFLKLGREVKLYRIVQSCTINTCN
jgi:hypothetical protein